MDEDDTRLVGISSVDRLPASPDLVEELGAGLKMEVRHVERSQGRE